MDATLTLKDRIQLNFILPQEDNFESLILREEVLESVKIDSKDIKKYKIKTSDDGNILFEIKDKDNKFIYKFTESQSNYIGEKLVELSDKKKLNSDLLSLYKLFCKR